MGNEELRFELVQRVRQQQPLLRRYQMGHLDHQVIQEMEVFLGLLPQKGLWFLDQESELELIHHQFLHHVLELAKGAEFKGVVEHVFLVADEVIVSGQGVVEEVEEIHVVHSVFLLEVFRGEEVLLKLHVVVDAVQKLLEFLEVGGDQLLLDGQMGPLQVSGDGHQEETNDCLHLYSLVLHLEGVEKHVLESEGVQLLLQVNHLVMQHFFGEVFLDDSEPDVFQVGQVDFEGAVNIKSQK